jgi:hypothetical protein
MTAIGAAADVLICARAVETPKEQTPLPPELVRQSSGHTRWIYSADLSVFTRHTFHEAFVVKALAWDSFINDRSNPACGRSIDRPHL